MISSFIHKVTKDKEGSYYTIAFDVPENITKIMVSYEYHRGTKGALADLFPKNTIDLGLMDENGTFLGWSGSAHKSISVGEYGSSKGYLSKPINPGSWQIIVGAYHVVDEGVDVKYTIEFEEKKELVLYGDLHIHSNASDGKFDIPTIGNMAKKYGLDFIGIANHNNYSENFNLPHIDDLTFIPAVEWTHYKGHMNFFGVEAPFENSFIANSEEDMINLINHAKALGAVVSVNHPKCPFCPYLWKNEEIFDMAEIWNGPMRGTNIRGLAWWTELLKTGRKIPVVGGSDYHKPGILVKFANPVTAVITPSRSKEDILNALRCGHSFISDRINGAKLFLKYGSCIQGDSVAYTSDTKLSIKAENIKGTKLILVSDNGEKLICKNKDRFEGEISVDKCKFVYVKTERYTGKLKHYTAVSNPIYFIED